ncbi:VanZ family protein [Catalinimonas niigatensis]|uniref:VanZ family protein n=1 Tax=Catalinimonas niigatensis TaxID=1397264 RepID=UPI0026654A72|nr:VanZ family protein [Catalinimonas niigatensis]WPP52919.1 VanZ family protein [Catalinimonas niigatensis]
MRKILLIIFTLTYLSLAAWLLFFTSAGPLHRQDGREKEMILSPFKTTSHFLMNALESERDREAKILLFNVGGNILLFIPMGIILYEFLGKRNTFFYLISGFMLSLTVETLQFITRRGTFDIDDLIWNTTGMVLGFWIWKKTREMVCAKQQASL